MLETGKRGIHTAPGEGVSIRNPVGGPLTFKARASETGGSLTALESVAAAGEGPPLHVHPGVDEALYVLDGAFRFSVDGEIREAPAGTLVFVPRGTPHTWQNVGAEQGRLLVVFTPGATGMETFFERFGALPADEVGLDAFGALAAGAGMEVVGAPLAQSHPLA